MIGIAACSGAIRSSENTEKTDKNSVTKKDEKPSPKISGPRFLLNLGHADKLTKIIWSPDGNRLVTASTDNTAKIWDRKTGALLASLQGHARRVEDISFSPDGKKLATASTDNTAKIWDSQTGALLSTLKCHPNFLQRVLWSSDGRKLIAASDSIFDFGSIRVWTITNGGIFTNTKDIIGSHFSLSPDSTKLAVDSYEPNSVKIFDLETGELLDTMIIRGGSVADIAWSPDGTRLATMSSDNTTKIWDTKTGETLKEFKATEYHPRLARILWSADSAKLTIWGAKSSLVSIRDSISNELITTVSQGWDDYTGGPVWNPDSTKLATIGDNSDASIWDGKTGKKLTVFERPQGSIRKIAWSPDGNYLAGLRGSDGLIWNEKTGKILVTLKGQPRKAKGVLWSLDGSRFAKLFNDKIEIWDGDKGSLLTILEQQDNDRIDRVSWSPDGRLATLSLDNTINIWDGKTGELLNILEGHSEKMDSVSWSFDGSRLATLSRNQIKIWDGDKGALLTTFEQQDSGRIDRVSWSPDNTRLAIVRYRILTIWNVDSHTLLATVKGYTMGAGVSWSSDSSKLATAGSSKIARIWDGNTGALLTTLEGHSDRIMHVSWRPNSDILATGGYDRTAKIWDGETGRLITTLEGHLDCVSRVVWSPGGNKLATSGRDGLAKIWDGETGRLITTLKGHSYSRNVSWSPDGNFLSIAGSSLYIYRLMDSKYLSLHTFKQPDQTEAVLIHTEEGLFSGDEAAFENVIFSVGPDISSIEHQRVASETQQIIDAFHRPNLYSDFINAKPIEPPSIIKRIENRKL